jgi:hypothetical protein
VVSRGFERRRGRRWRLTAAVVLIATAAPPADAWPRTSYASGPAGPSLPAFAQAQDENYDPAAAYFYSLLTFGAMRLIAPAIFGDFQSPVALSYAPQWSGVMLQGAGLDTAVSTMLNAIARQELLPTGGALMAEEFGVSASPGSSADGDVAPPRANGPNFNVSAPTGTGDLVDPAVEAGGIEPICAEDEIADKLQAGGEYWNDEGAGVGAARLAPAQFPLGVFARPVTLANPLGDLGPTGDRTNLAAPGAAGGWCRPGREPFSLSSPLEDDLLWIAFSIVLGALLVAWLSRGAQLPAI